MAAADIETVSPLIGNEKDVETEPSVDQKKEERMKRLRELHLRRVRDHLTLYCIQ